MWTLYCIPGFAADHRVFENLIIPQADLKPVLWPPIEAGTTMQEYAARVADTIPEGSNTAILGLSFGGMLASEIARLRPNAKIILVSAAKTHEECPFVPGLLRFLGRNHLFPLNAATTWQLELAWPRLGASTQKEKDLLTSMFEKADKNKLNCFISAIVDWKSGPAPQNIIQIHGTADAVIPSENVVKPTYWINGGTHVMIYNRSAEVSALISHQLS
jgi:pimeloyl-ACP methyl ester carboxylesterase